MKKIYCFLTMILIVLTISGCAAEPGNNSEQNSSAESTLSVDESKAEIIESKTSQAEKTSSDQNVSSSTKEESNTSSGYININGGWFPDLSHIEPVPAEDMTNAQIIEFLEESLSIDLPDSIVLKPGCQIKFTFEQKEDLTQQSIWIQDVSASFYNDDLEALKKSLSNNSWKIIDEKQKMHNENFRNIISDKDVYLYYEKEFRRFYNIISYVSIVMFPSLDSDKYDLIINGVIDNDTNQNGIIYTK